MTDTADWTWGDVAEEVAPRSATVPIVLNGQVAAALDAARARLAQARRENDTLDAGALDEPQAEVDRLKAEAQRTTRDFTVRSIGYRAWRELIAAHPPKSDGDRWNPDTFIPAALHTCCDQISTPAHADDAVTRLATGQIAKLFAKIRELNEGDDRVPL